ncbi:type I polyketide synthase, partial [Streptomyces sp. NPDC047315]|uniref:type I polyketide synthase n=1 Tax=Streptomyces sp. NPDC047315 TaxID=3155142 RepID=UPI0033E828CB
MKKIAVVGLSCRLPGAPGPLAFWELLRSGGNGISRRPDGRRGGFLTDVDAFDAGFFGLSPREAAAMDPQQRLVLELAWEALEDAGTVPGALAGSRAGVFVGASRDDYARLVYRHGADAITQYSMAGLNRGVIANRVSHHLDLRGPSFTVDTAQSSSLVAVHLACESLRSGECPTALVAGVNLSVLAEQRITEERFGGLSPDGTCYAFDARANGFVPGEGGAAVVLKPLDSALADGDRVYGVLHGSAVNNDGATTGLTVPSGPAQEQVIRRAYEGSGIDARSVQYVEAHGTGTPVGDPVEAAALGAALGAARPADDPLRIGSAKTNIGHLEGAAGLVGLLKTLLGLYHRELPPSRNFDTPNPAIPFAELGLTVQRTVTPWPHPDRDPVAGVSSFGMGGANCHVVVGAAPTTTVARGREQRTAAPAVVPWVVTGRGAAALRAQARRLGDAVRAGRTGADAVDTGWSLATTRTAFDHRAVVLADGRGEREDVVAELLRGLDTVADGASSLDAVSGTARPGRLAVLFSGQGSQRTLMGAELYATHPAFAEAFDDVCGHLDPLIGRGLAEVIGSGAGLDDTRFTQPALFALEVALFRLVQSWGVRPDLLAGHSVGEVAAAHVAGILSLADACALVEARGRLMAALPPGGAMFAVEATEDEVRSLVGPRVAVAAVNGPRAVVLSGAAEPTARIAARLAADGRRTTRLQVSHAFHSPLVEPVLADFRAVVETLRFHRPTTTVVSTVTGLPVDDGLMSAPEYWVEQVRRPVRFFDAVRAMESAGTTTYLELGPDAVCSAMAAASVRDPAAAAQTSALRADRHEARTLVAALATVFVRGGNVDWSVPYATTGARRTELPTYAFQRERHWFDAAEPAAGHAPPPEQGPPRDAEALADVVSAHVAAVLGHVDRRRIEPHRTFGELGFDSLTAEQLSTELSAATGLHLAGGLLYDHPTPAALVAHLTSLLPHGDAHRAAEVQTPPLTPPYGTEPVAVVGMACRYPGAVTSPEDLWQLVVDGVDAVTEFPADRGWPDAPHGGNPSADPAVRRGGFLDGAGDFDAEFFGISPREALGMDPQQRLLLETAWEAVERAGIDPRTLNATRTSVFVGATTLDYGPRMHEADDAAQGHVLTGTASSVMSGRIAHHLGLVGPAVTVDTACSSSLVALHMAVRSLRSGESALALAGGVAVMSSPGMFVEFSRQGGLAPDGRSKAFSADADGTSWSEGAGLLLLERLDDARRNGHRVLAVIRGSAVNQDGASNGLTAPNGPSQQRVMREALADAGLTPADVDAVEAHGTGTRLGDPIEAEALLATYGSGRAGRAPVYLGSLKSNIGHAQAAAGVGGVIKMVLALRHGVLPRTLHVHEPTPHVDWRRGDAALLTEQRPWPATDRPRRAAVSSFGISGTNAHVVIEQAADDTSPHAPNPDDDTSPQAVSPDNDTSPHSLSPGDGPAPVVPWAVSGRTDAALRAQAARLHHRLSRGPFDPADVAHALAATRTDFEERAVVTGSRPADLLSGLDALARGAQSPRVVRGSATSPARTALLFTGQGAQRVGMGRELYRAHPEFAAAFDAVCAALDAYLDRPLTSVVHLDGPARTDSLDRTEFAQPALFAFEVALARLLAHHGLTPDSVAGHSVGELAAAHVAGLWSLPDAARLVTARGRLMQSAPAGGAMFAVQATEEEVRETLADRPAVVLAAVNGPDAVVVSGDADAAEAVAAVWRARGRRTRRLAVSHAFHSPHMDGVLDDFRAVADSVTYRTPRIPLVSTVTGEIADEEELRSPAYWVRQLREPVRFLDAVRTLEAVGADVLLEVGPDAVLTAAATDSLRGATTTAVPLQRAGRSEPEAYVTGLARAHTAGARTDLAAFFPGAAPVDLPTYAFQRHRYWLRTTGRGDARHLGLDPARHPLLATAVELADRDETVFTSALSLDEHPWLGDHRVGGAVLVPATLFLELALAAAEHSGADEVAELTLESPLVLPERGGVRLQVTIAAPDAADRRPFTVHSAPAEAPDTGASDTGASDTGKGAARSWVRHASGSLGPSAPSRTGEQDPLPWPPPGAAPEPVADAYERLAAIGYEYGPAFQGLHALWRAGDDLYAELRLGSDERTGPEGFVLHPALLDAVLHPLVLAAADPDRPESISLPFAWTGVAAARETGVTELRARISPTGPDTFRLALADGRGTPVASVESLALRPVSRQALSGSDDVVADGLFGVVWERVGVSLVGGGGWVELGVGGVLP